MILDIKDFSCRYLSRKKETISHLDLSLNEGEMVLLAGGDRPSGGCRKEGRHDAVRQEYFQHDS